MAGLGHRAWIPGETITADNVQQYLQDQAVQVYDNAAARGSALVGFVAEGMVSYLKDTNQIEYFDSSSWTNVIPSSFPSSVISTPVNSRGTAFAITSADINEFVLVSAAVTVTINNVLGAGQSVNFIQTGTGQITFTPGSGVTLLSKNSARKTKAQYSAATVVGAGGGVYYLVGDIGS
jgi:hypothetical protein